MAYVRGVEIPDVGSDSNTWGDIESAWKTAVIQFCKGEKSIAISGNHSLTTTNGGTDNDINNMALKFTDGGLSSAPTVTLPGSVDNIFLIENATTYAITFTAGGTTGSLPAGRFGFVICDGTDVRINDPVSDSVDQVSYAEEWATKAEDSLISTDAGGDGATDYSALHHAAKAAASATAAAASASGASSSATAASGSASNAATSETNAAASETAAAASAASVNADSIEAFAFFMGNL